MNIFEIHVIIISLITWINKVVHFRFWWRAKHRNNVCTTRSTLHRIRGGEQKSFQFSLIPLIKVSCLFKILLLFFTNTNNRNTNIYFLSLYNNTAHTNILQNFTLSITERYKYAIYLRDIFVSTTKVLFF